MLNQILDLSQQLIRIKTDPDNYSELDKAIEVIRSNLSEFTVEEFEKNGYKSILAYSSPQRPAKFKVILNGHLDVIPGKPDQYNPLVKDGRLYGVGAMDMKSNLSSLLFAFKQMAKIVDYPLGLQIVTDEEVGGFNTTKYQIESGVDSEFVIASEPTNLNIVNQAKGVFMFEVTFVGKTAHGAYPWKGNNAIELANDFVNSLKELYPNPNQEEWSTTYNVAKVSSDNNSYNKVPDNCILGVDIRFVPQDKDSVKSSVESLLKANSTLKIIELENPLYTPETNQYIQKIMAAHLEITQNPNKVYSANGSSDSRHYTDIGSYGVEFGPIGGGIGEDVEWVDIQSLETYYDIICVFLKSVE